MPALQCPDCGHREPLEGLGDVVTFSCGGCGRPLKVPAQFRNADASPVPEAAAAPAPTQRVAVQGAAAPADQSAAGADQSGERPDWREEFPLATVTADAAQGPLPWWARALIWLYALPLSLVIVFSAAHSFGWLTREDLVNTITDVGWDRFVPVARVLPLAALLTAVIVQVSVVAIEALRKRRGHGRRAPRVQRTRPTAS